MKFWKGIAFAAATACAFSACEKKDAGTRTGQRAITILATNDIHGGVDAQTDKSGQSFGGLSLLSSAIHAIKTGIENKGQGMAGVLVVDAGDQFQGSLVSNFDEGQLLFSAMNQIGYDAAIPGNHDYDFGPIGWLDDRVTPATQDQNPRGALQRLAQQANFPLLAANTYYKNSLVDLAGNPVAVKDVGCPALNSGTVIDWTRAKRLEFAQPYVIKTIADVRVALIGIDSQYTPKTTTAENVSDLCFRDEAEAFLSVRAEIGDQADLFVMIVHDGNSDTEFSASELLKKIEKAQPGSVNAVLAGHTHFVNHVQVDGIPLIQSGSGGEMFGRIDLVYDFDSKQAKMDLVRSYAGLRLNANRCAPGATDFCATGDDGFVSYEGVSAKPDPAIAARVADAEKALAPIADRVLGHADATVTRDRISESPLSDLMTDAFREISGADVATINTAGLREVLAAGDVTYADLFRVIPFNNHGVILGPMPAEKLLKLLARSIKTCGGFGALMQSGLRVTFTRDCSHPKNGLDPDAKLEHVETLGGEVIYDLARGVAPQPGRSFTVATLDFLADGGSGFDGFAGTPVIRDIGILREAMTSHFLTQPFSASGQVDGRWEQVQSGF